MALSDSLLQNRFCSKLFGLIPSAYGGQKRHRSGHGPVQQDHGGHTPLEADRITPAQSRRRPVPVQSLRDDQEVIASLLSDEYDPNAIETGEELLFLRPGVPLRVWRRFRRGHYAIEAELDLHGCNVSGARELVDHFLHRAQQHGQRCVRIIHGRGRSSAGKIPVLKGKVNAWLQQKDAVLGFCSARPNDGGTGAVYVLLKRI